ncbi:putative ensconsin-like [Cocos nucifera]|uniref:Putative ensconsin-like n=1 Tax=Cocos nucifera TaxID=13894 RepID=A0A8K0ID70_COCNU|nr:putative ensconsin-like [Cocos nucifera]
MEDCIIPNIIEKILRADNQEKKKDCFVAFIELGHHLFANVEAVSLRKIEIVRATKEVETARAEAKDAWAEVKRLK